MIIYGYIKWYKEKTTGFNKNYLTVCVIELSTLDIHYLTVFENLIPDLCKYYKEHCNLYFKIKKVGNYKNVNEMSNYEYPQEYIESYYPDKILKGFGNPID
ncbi:MAG: hypothetical protein WCO37_11445 [Bacteroidota bacterium]|jgi:hypothetical protein